MQLILKSPKYFQFLDYHISHQQLLIRSQGDLESENIDISFEGTDFLNCPTTFKGIELYLLDEEDTQEKGLAILPFTRTFLIKTDNREYYIHAGTLRIFKNNLLPLERTLMTGRGQEELLYMTR